MSAFLAGVLIGIGNVALVTNDKLVGAVLFSVALLSIIELRLPLYTGRIGKVLTNRNPAELLLILCLNAFGTLAVTAWYLIAYPGSGERFREIGEAKYSKPLLTLFVAGILCNVLIHVAVSARKELITVLCIAAFILCGFEHSVADAGYLPFGGSLLRWLVIVAGNTVGGIGTELLLKEKI